MRGVYHRLADPERERWRSFGGRSRRAAFDGVRQIDGRWDGTPGGYQLRLTAAFRYVASVI